MAELLIELFSEEIPARMQARAAQDLERLVTQGLAEAGLEAGDARSLVTPRRLVLVVNDLPARSPDTTEERKGPRVDAPEKALEGFLRATGLQKSDLEQRKTPKGAVWFAQIEHPGRPAAEIVSEVLVSVIRSFPWPKSMRWGAGELRWVRPLHRILALVRDEAGAEIVPLEIDGIKAANVTEGHRFMAPEPFAVSGFEDYASRLREAFVLIDPEERARRIHEGAEAQAGARGLELVEDPRLLAEVTGLVEWPVVLMGDIAPEFVTLPPEVLQTSMREHQKFFSVQNPKTGRIEHFITVANRETRDGGATILAGNQKVLAARLSDARFFWENDLRKVRDEGLEAMAAPLAQVTFHRKLGTQADRIARITALAGDIAPMVGAPEDETRLAGRVCKADLASEMVYEFPELQGIMGRYYALEAGLPPAVADACRDHWAPTGAGDDVPRAPVSVAVALADKLDMLTGFWSIDEKPTGSKDPFGLRRAALGVIRIVLENELRLHLGRLIDAQLLRNEARALEADEQALVEPLAHEVSQAGFDTAAAAIEERFGAEHPEWARNVLVQVPITGADLMAFIHERLKVHLRDEGIRHDVIDACLAMPASDDLVLLVRRARALDAFLATDDGENLIQGFRRANNILSQAEERDGVEYSFGADIRYAQDDSERALFAALDAAETRINEALAREDFATAMEALASLRGPIDAFFEAVQVNTDNQIVRRNRLNLLARIRAVCLSVADLTRIEG